MTTQNTLVLPASLIGLLYCLTVATASNSIDAKNQGESIWMKSKTFMS